MNDNRHTLLGQMRLRRDSLRGFCSECGAPIVVKPDVNPQIVVIRTVSRDDPNWSQIDGWTSDAHPWDRMNPALRKSEEYPQEKRGKHLPKSKTVCGINYRSATTGIDTNRVPTGVLKT
jgi:hypothetical protein